MLALEVPGLKEHLEDLLEKRFVRPSVSPWITPGLLVTKRMIEWNNKHDMYNGIEAMESKTWSFGKDWSLRSLRELMEILRKPLNVDVLLRLRVLLVGC